MKPFVTVRQTELLTCFFLDQVNKKVPFVAVSVPKGIEAEFWSLILDNSSLGIIERFNYTLTRETGDMMNKRSRIGSF